MSERVERNEALFRAVLEGANFREAGERFGIRAARAREIFYRLARRRAEVPAGVGVEEIRGIFGEEKEAPG